ncbi:hypothetical protein Ctob_014839 [Chrysochromulina tobinii]|uniref:Uncharacterized protein n=1 Tax=Chrysochromulina tobinii TaxID=1460289 RepID=A0A0M0KAN1_9EUKA|nr:hypothetical protein Ctob_014839 [Chrysochromulina tobinii]|eukprot:KOO35657.1 hypothetical protein Ctob_014839 [Chrysochromulina sp. CCMP291]
MSTLLSKFQSIPAAVPFMLFLPVSSRLEQDTNAGLVTILGSQHQGGRTVRLCLIWVSICLEQDANAGLVAILGSGHQGGHAGGRCHIWVRLCLE